MPRRKLTELMSWPDIVQKIQEDSKKVDPKFRNWLESKEGQGYLFSPLMYRRCWNIWKSITKDNRDHFVCVAGKEGDGKSNLAIKIAATVDPTFCTERICFNMADFVRGIKTAQKGQAFILDEGNLFLFSRESLSADNKFMLKLMALMRQRNLLVVICVPNFFTLDSYVRDHRVDTLVYLRPGKRGNYCCYVRKAIKIIGKEGKQLKQVGGHKIPDGLFFPGYFSKGFPKLPTINEESYERHKAENFDRFLEDIEQTIAERHKKSALIPVSEASKLVTLSPDTLKRYVKEGVVKGKQIGKKWFVSRENLLEIPDSKT